MGRIVHFPGWNARIFTGYPCVGKDTVVCDAGIEKQWKTRSSEARNNILTEADLDCRESEERNSKSK